MTGQSITFSAPEHSISVPSKITWHMISDEELAMLSAGGNDTSLEWGLALGGIGAGLVPTFFKTASTIWGGRVIDISDGIQSLLSFALLAVAVVLIIYHRKNAKGVSGLERQIRDREHGVPLRVVGGNGYRH